MTEQTQPTDAEILDAADDFRSQYKHGGTTFDEFDALGFARAVLAKWGTPAGAGEPVAKLWLWKNFVGGKPEYWAFDNPFPCVSAGGDPLTLGEPCGWALLKPSVNGRPQRSEQEVTNTVYRLHATPQPTQAQAGAVPLTVEQLYEERQTAIPQLFDLAQQWADNKIHSYQFANEAEKIVDAVARRVESAHGITAHGVADMKGGQDVAE